MGLIRRLTEERNEHILRKARPFLADSEEVIDWVRARHPDDNRRGIFYITKRRCIVHWSGRHDGHTAYEWDDLNDWDLDPGVKGGPVLRMETDEGVSHIQLVVATKRMVDTLRGFLRTFAELAPWPADTAVDVATAGRLKPQGDPELRHEPRTPRELFKRIAFTVIGVVLIVVGVAIIPLPGPWSFVLNIAGLAILAREYDWADDLLDWSKEKFSQARKRVTKRKRARPERR